MPMLNVTYWTLLPKMIRHGFNRVDSDGDFRFQINNKKLHNICHTEDISTFIRKQEKNYTGHVVWMPVDCGIKQLMFNSDKNHRIGRTTPSLLEQVWSDNNLTVERLINVFKNEKRNSYESLIQKGYHNGNPNWIFYLQNLNENNK